MFFSIELHMQDVTSQSLPKLPPRELESHKGDYGRVLIIGGSRGMAGAPALAGMAALRSGAGLVTLAVPQSIQATVASFEPSYMTLGVGSATDDCLVVDCEAELLEAATIRDVVALGPGLGTTPSTAKLVCNLYSKAECPLIVDADALNALANSPQHLESPGGVRILTPHPGEMQRLTGLSSSNDPLVRAEQATALSLRDPNGHTVVVLKGHRTVVAAQELYAFNESGNPGMATGGTGDCLTGIITALVAQGMQPFDAARLGVHVHGLAGDLAANELGQRSLIASDLIQFLPAAFQQLT